MSAPTSIQNSPCHSAFDWQRKRTSSVAFEDDHAGPSTKVKRSQYYYILASDSDTTSDDGTESVYSIQEKETDYAKDTSDTDTKSEMSDDYDYQVEYEVVSTTDVDQVFSNDSTSENDTFVAAGAATTAITEKSGLDIWLTDGEDDTDSIPSDCDRLLKYTQTCRRCKLRVTQNNLPLCQPCHQIRKTYFPPRPRKHRSKKNRVATSSSSLSQVTAASLRSCLSSLSSQDSGIKSSQELKSVVNLQMDQVKIPESLISKSSEISESSISQSAEFKSGSEVSDTTWANWALASKEMCIMCNEKPKNGIFLHATRGHMCCCYQCAVKYWNKSKRCAYCNQKVSNVLRVYIA